MGPHICVDGGRDADDLGAEFSGDEQPVFELGQTMPVKSRVRKTIVVAEGLERDDFQIQVIAKPPDLSRCLEQVAFANVETRRRGFILGKRLKIILKEFNALESHRRSSLEFGLEGVETGFAERHGCDGWAEDFPLRRVFMLETSRDPGKDRCEYQEEKAIQGYECMLDSTVTIVYHSNLGMR